MKRSVVLGFGALLIACSEQAPEQLPPRGQVVLHVTTNAPLPAAPGEVLGPEDPPPLFDFLRLDVYEPGSAEPCAGCSEEWELDREKILDPSIGIVIPPGETGYVVHARLYRRISSKDGKPPPLETIDVHAAVPEIAVEGIVHATIELDVENVGRPLGSLAAPIEARAGKPNDSWIGSWPRAQRVPCAGPANAGEVCVPGGAFWMGHPYAPQYEDGTYGGASRLVVVNPFYVDLKEVTVGDYRASNLATIADGTSVDPNVGRSAENPLPEYDYQYYCTYTDAPLRVEASREDHPLNCVSWYAADAYCSAQGKSLPSEAEYEYVASGLRSDLFVWGGEQADCDDSVWGRGPAGFDQCLSQGVPGGPLPAGTGTRDRLKLAGGEVLDLAGNVSEWTRDTWNRIDEACWLSKPLLDNPQCSTPSAIDGDRRTIKGGPWNVYIPPAAFRIGRPPDATLRSQTGFRCVRHAG